MHQAGLCNDMGFLAHLPELCDITFMVGPDKEPVCAVRAVLGNIRDFSVLQMMVVNRHPLRIFCIHDSIKG